jgi:two-component sensor histidine kinase
MHETTLPKNRAQRPDPSTDDLPLLLGRQGEIERLRQERDEARAQHRTALTELARVTRDLEERDTLLREADHRLRNAMHQACAMLLQQAMEPESGGAREVLTAAARRLQAIGELKISLHAIGDDVRIADVLARICRAVVADPAVEVEVQAPELRWPAATASPVALFASEAICNALKYAFPEAGPGRILVRLAAAGDDEWRLSVSDDGRGAPTAVKPGFGMRLLSLLARQLRGSLDVIDGLDSRGLCVSVTFPDPNAKPRLAVN